MTEESITNECADPTQALTIEIPCALAARVERYVSEDHDANRDYVAGFIAHPNDVESEF